MFKLHQLVLKKTLFDKIFQKRTLVLSYKLIGDNATSDNGNPVMILHGLLESKQRWTAFAKTINTITKRLVLLVDIRNHGNSPHAVTHRYDELINDIKELYNKLEMNITTLVGYDMGGRVAMALSLTAPKSVASLLVIDVSPVSSPKELTIAMPKLLEAMKTFNISEYKTKKKAKNTFLTTLESITNNDDLIKVILENIVFNKHKLSWICNVDTLVKDFDNIASFPTFTEIKYSGPTLFIGGQLSDYIPPDDLPAIRELFPSTVIKYIREAGHYPHIDNPTLFLENVLPFLHEFK